MKNEKAETLAEALSLLVDHGLVTERVVKLAIVAAKKENRCNA